MKLLVLAQTPPPAHGQSFMVQTLVESLPKEGIELHHVPLNLSRHHAEIGQPGFRKIALALSAAAKARRLARNAGCDALYYVPAPGKRFAVWRDALVLGRARSACPKLILHFHAPGLASWLTNSASPIDRRLAKVLARPDLALVLAENLREDATALGARRTAVVPNGIPDPAPSVPAPRRVAGSSRNILFLGLCAEDKGTHVLLAAVRELRSTGEPVRVTFAGAFPSKREQASFTETAAALGDAVTFAGFVAGADKDRLLAECDVLCLPTFYAHEGQPLVLLEALAHDVPIVATTWRGIPGTVPAPNILVPPRDVSALAGALREILRTPPPVGLNRAHFLAHFTRERHVAALAAAVRSVETA
jgi:glycosyltransferase involved in cell wall biosynthesis